MSENPDDIQIRLSEIETRLSGLEESGATALSMIRQSDTPQTHAAATRAINNATFEAAFDDMVTFARAMELRVLRLAGPSASHDCAKQILHDYLEPDSDLVMACHRVIERIRELEAEVAALEETNRKERGLRYDMEIQRNILRNRLEGDKPAAPPTAE